MGMKSQDLAEAIGVSPVSLSRYQNGHQSMEASVLIKLAQVIGCNLNWLLLGIGEPTLGSKKGADLRSDFFLREIIDHLKSDPDSKQIVYEMLHCGDSISRFMEITKSYLTKKSTSSKTSKPYDLEGFS
jgi:transcriptional regulator with XRE-family HTH domain